MTLQHVFAFVYMIPSARVKQPYRLRQLTAVAEPEASSHYLCNRGI